MTTVLRVVPARGHRATPSGPLRSRSRGSRRRIGRRAWRGSRRFRPGRSGSGRWSWPSRIRHGRHSAQVAAGAADARRHDRHGDHGERVGHAHGPSAGGGPPTTAGRACHDRGHANLTPRRSRAAAGGFPRSRPSGRASRGGGPSTGPPRPPNATRRGRPWIGGGRRAASFGRATRPDTLVIGDGSGFARSGSGPTFRLLSLRPAGAADLASNSEAVRRRSSPVVAAEGETPPDRCMKCRSLGCRLWSVDPIHPVRWRPDRPSGSMHGVAMVQPVPQPGPTPVLRSVHEIRPQGVALHVSADG